MVLTADGCTVVESTPGLEGLIHYRLMNQYSTGERDVYGGSYGFYPDGNEWRYVNAAGQGLINNYVNIPESMGGNIGLQHRTKKCRNFVAAAQAFGRDLVMSSATLRQEASDSVLYDMTPGPSCSWVAYYIMASFRLADISDVFSQMPLTAGLRGVLELTLNLGASTFTMDTQANSRTLVATGSNFVNGSCPFMITNPALGTSGNQVYPAQYDSVAIIPQVLKTAVEAQGAYGWKPNTNAAIALNATIAIGAPSAATQYVAGVNGQLYPPAHRLQQCWLRVPYVHVAPDLLSSYLSSGRQTLVNYSGVKRMLFSAQQPGNTINALIQASIQNPLFLLICCYYTNGGANVALPSALSPWSCAPACPDPVVLGNFNVSINGEWIYGQNTLYTREQFDIEQKEAAGILNGGQGHALVSGLISERAFTCGQHSYYYVNLARRYVDSKAPCNIQLTCVNQSLLPIDLVCFTGFKRELMCDVMTGTITTNVQA
jgi:hypothetical protein